MLGSCCSPYIHIDKNCNGYLFHSENFHALKLLRTRFYHAIKYTYIDPPYNTISRDTLPQRLHAYFLDSFDGNRLSVAAPVLMPDGVLTVAIDDNELLNLGS